MAATDIGLAAIAFAALLLVNGAVRAVLAGMATRSKTRLVTARALPAQLSA
jgi:hypothetical protein